MLMARKALSLVDKRQKPTGIQQTAYSGSSKTGVYFSNFSMKVLLRTALSNKNVKL